MKYFVATYSCDYTGCNDEHYVIADSRKQVETYMHDGIYDYAASYEYIPYCEWFESEDRDSNDFDSDDFYESQEHEDFLGGIFYDIKEVTSEDLEEAKRDCGDNWEDIR